jgi:hypothetical protein
VSSSTKVTPFEATFGYDPRVPLWEGVQYPGDKVVERKDFAEYLAQVKHTQLATREIAHHNNQQTRTEYTDKYNTANKGGLPKVRGRRQVVGEGRGQEHGQEHIAASPSHTVARQRNGVARRIPAVARDPATNARDPTTIRGDDDTSASQREGGGN